MRLSTQHKKLSELVFYQDILQYFRDLDGLREISDKFWHESGKYFYRVNPVFTQPTQGGFFIATVHSGRDDRYAVVELYSSDINYYFNSTWGHAKQDTLVSKIILAPRGPSPITPEINADLNATRIQGSINPLVVGVGGTLNIINNDATLTGLNNV